jgi:predicted GH43/DUF377 family glycosyl hydrolase
MPFRTPKTAAGAVLFTLFLLALSAPAARALVRFDFEQAYYSHPQRQVWDFSVTKVDSTYHIFYHSIHEATPHATNADTLWHATSPDLRHWNAPEPILTSGTGHWDTASVWAPDVFRDEDNDRWGLAYTGADAGMNQRMGLAFSQDLFTWTPAVNPILEPDSAAYNWSPTGLWSDFRDPFLWQDGGGWHVLLTAKQSVGVLYHAVSQDLVSWTDVGPLFRNDGNTPAKVLESSQYHVIDGVHHLLFGEFDTVGISHVAAADPADLTMDDRVFIDPGYAPELDEFDPGVRIFSRLGVQQAITPGQLSYVVRFDTMLVSSDRLDLTVHRPHPLAADWEIYSGTATLGNPTYGDNPRWRGEPSVGLVGNGFFGSQEYYQGPLSGRGTPGTSLGGTATGTLVSRPFVIEGDRIDLLVGGGRHWDKLYVALVDAVTDSILVRATGDDDPHLDPVTWDVKPYKGRLCRIRIVDNAAETGAFINVDEIIEAHDDPVAGIPAAPAGLAVRAVPNPCNPRTEIRFELPDAARAEVRLYDLRGRLVWSDGGRDRQGGTARVAWDGRDIDGRAAATGSYIARVIIAGRPAGSVKISLVR